MRAWLLCLLLACAPLALRADEAETGFDDGVAFLADPDSEASYEAYHEQRVWPYSVDLSSLDPTQGATDRSQPTIAVALHTTEHTDSLSCAPPSPDAGEGEWTTLHLELGQDTRTAHLALRYDGAGVRIRPLADEMHDVRCNVTAYCLSRLDLAHISRQPTLVFRWRTPDTELAEGASAACAAEWLKQAPAPPSHFHAAVLWAWFAILLLALLVALGVYWWRRRDEERRKQLAHAQYDELMQTH